MIFLLKPSECEIKKNTNYVTLRCPACRQLGTFQPAGDQAILVYGQPVSGKTTWLGSRRCPNESCHAHVFVAIAADTGKVLESYPPERIDFDASAIPAPIVKSLEDAITCHANGVYPAAAIMVRRTLEDLCEDQKATGGDLYKRLETLRSTIIIPKELFDGLHNLRLLGNDAVHVEARVYNQIGKEEVEVAIDVAKEVLKSVYQLSNLVARLDKLKQPKTP